MTVLNIISRTECDMQGIPLDWERCRACGATGLVRVRGKGESGALKPCPTCDGHGSLREAVRAALTREAPQVGHVACAGTGRLVEVWPQADGSGDIGDRCHCVTFELRCEGCGHPMSDGTWEYARVGDDDPGIAWPHALSLIDEYQKQADEFGGDGPMDRLARGEDPVPIGPAGIYYSRCDEGCRHGGPGRWRMIGNLIGPGGEHKVWEAGVDLVPHHGVEVEAPWRPVDVRTLDWPHDLRPEMLAVLCLRCLAAR